MSMLDARWKRCFFFVFQLRVEFCARKLSLDVIRSVVGMLQIYLFPYRVSLG